MLSKEMMSKGKISYVIFCLVLILIASVSLTDAADKPITLKFSAFFTKPTPSGPLTMEFCRRLEEASKGKVKIDIYWAGALGPAKEQLDVVVGGLADLALHFPVYTPARLPSILFAELPVFAENSQEGTEVILELMRRKLITDEFRKAGAKLLTSLSWPPNNIFSNRKLTKVEDFKGLRIWSSGPVMAKTYSLLGSAGILLTWADIYTGLERGTLDAFPATWSSSKALKLFEVCKYPIAMGCMGGYVGTIIMNNASWKKLPPDVRVAWEKVGREFAADHAKAFDTNELANRNVWKQKGIQEVVFPFAEKQRFAQKLIPVWQHYIDINEKNGKPAKAIYKTYVGVMKKLGRPVMVQIPGLYE